MQASFKHSSIILLGLFLIVLTTGFSLSESVIPDPSFEWNNNTWNNLTFTGGAVCYQSITSQNHSGLASALISTTNSIESSSATVYQSLNFSIARFNFSNSFSWWVLWQANASSGARDCYTRLRSSGFNNLYYWYSLNNPPPANNSNNKYLTITNPTWQTWTQIQRNLFEDWNMSAGFPNTENITQVYFTCEGNHTNASCSGTLNCSLYALDFNSCNTCTQCDIGGYTCQDDPGLDCTIFNGNQANCEQASAACQWTPGPDTCSNLIAGCNFLQGDPNNLGNCSYLGSLGGGCQLSGQCNSVGSCDSCGSEEQCSTQCSIANCSWTNATTFGQEVYWDDFLLNASDGIDPIASQGTNPVDYYNDTDSLVTFDLKCSDNSDISTIQLWTNTTGSWAVNYTNSSYTNDTWLNITVSGIPEGNNYKWAVYCNDSVGNSDWTDTNKTFLIDNTAPTITLPVYTNATRKKNTETLTLNISVIDSGVGASYCSINTNGTNQTIDVANGWCNSTAINLAGLADGNQTINAYSNDTLGNTALNNSFVVWVDSTAPQWSAKSEFYPTNYNSSSSMFNITWTDVNLQSVLIESNFSGTSQNTSMQDLGSGQYGYSILLGAGTYYWKSYANDSLGNLNVSDQVILTIEKAPTSIILLLNGLDGDNAITYPTQANATAILNISDLTFKIYRNDSEIVSGINLISNISSLSQGYYKFTSNFSGNDNYSSSTTTHYLTVLQATSSCSLIFSPPSPITYGTQLNVSCSCTNQEASLELYRNSTNITSQNNQLVMLAASSYDYICNVSSSQNYSSASNTSSFIINKNNSIVSLYIEGQQANRYYRNGTTLNMSCALSFPSQSETIEVWTNYSDGITKKWNSGVSPIENTSVFNELGDFFFKCNWSGNENFTNDYEQWILELTEVLPPDVSLNSPINYYNTSSQNILFNCSAIDDQNVTNLTLYGSWGGWHANETNSSPINNTQTIFNKTINNGTYVWNCYACDNESRCAFNSQNRTFTIDVVSPSFSQGLPADNSVVNDTSIQFDLKCSDTSGVHTIQLWTNTTGSWAANYTNSSYTNNTWLNITVAGISEGAYKWAVWCNDTAGNSNWTDNNRTFAVDREKPKIESLSPANSNSFSSGTTEITFSWNATDNKDENTSCRVYTKGALQSAVNCTNATNCTQTISGFSAGSYTWYVTCNDGVNYNSSETRSFTIQAGTSNPPGGGGGGGGTLGNNTGSCITIYLTSLSIFLEPETDSQQKITIKNNCNSTASLTVDFLNIPQFILIDNKTDADYNIQLNPYEEKGLTFTFSALENSQQGTYKANLSLTGSINTNIGINLVVGPKSNLLISELEINPLKQEIYAGGKLSFEVSFYNLKEDIETNVTLEIIIKNSKDETIKIYNKNYLFSNVLNLNETISLPYTILPGVYTIYARLIYGDKVAVSSSTFEVQMFEDKVSSQERAFIVSGLSVVLFLFVFLLLILLRRFIKSKKILLIREILSNKSLNTKDFSKISDTLVRLEKREKKPRKFEI